MSDIDLKNAAGTTIGVTVRLTSVRQTVAAVSGETAEQFRLRTIAANVAEWAAVNYPPSPWPFSETDAVTLFERFSWVADQIEAGMQS